MHRLCYFSVSIFGMKTHVFVNTKLSNFFYSHAKSKRRNFSKYAAASLVHWNRMPSCHPFKRISSFEWTCLNTNVGQPLPPVVHVQLGIVVNNDKLCGSAVCKTWLPWPDSQFRCYLFRFVSRCFDLSWLSLMFVHKFSSCVFIFQFVKLGNCEK